jgi:hypothetical protein
MEHREPPAAEAHPHRAHDLHGPLAEVADLPTDPLPGTPAPAKVRIRLRSAVPPAPAGAV